jgi:hypothetical protein
LFDRSLGMFDRQDWFGTAPIQLFMHHPLSQMRMELVWEGKYDESGDRQVDIVGCAIPRLR